MSSVNKLAFSCLKGGRFPSGKRPPLQGNRLWVKRPFPESECRKVFAFRVVLLLRRDQYLFITPDLSA